MRKTYIDNNGIERYEDNCKIVVKKIYTKEDNERVNKINDTFKSASNVNNSCSIDYLNYIESKCINDIE